MAGSIFVLIAAGVFSFSLGTTGAIAQTPMELNRAGRWQEALELAIQNSSDERLGVFDRCTALYGAMYAQTRLRRTSALSDLSARYEVMCAGVEAGTWLEAEVDALLADSPPHEVAPVEDDWPVLSPSARKELEPALAEIEALCHDSGADACVLAIDGKLALEFYGPDYAGPMMAMSSTKSITSLLAGQLIGQEKLRLDDPVSLYLPEWLGGAGSGITVQHLLAMTSGLPDTRAVGGDVMSVNDKEAHVFALRPIAAPGTRWVYSNDGVFLLSPLLDRAAGEPVEDFAARELFAPLGMSQTQFYVRPEGQAWTHTNLQTTPRDLARIGQMMLDNGRRDGKQVVPEDWVRLSTQPSQYLNRDYGLLWWLNVPGGFAARGALGNNIYVFPEMRMTLVRMQSQQANKRSFEPAVFAILDQMAR